MQICANSQFYSPPPPRLKYNYKSETAMTYSLHLYLVSLDFVLLWDSGLHLDRQTNIKIGEIILTSFFKKVFTLNK